MTLVNVAYGLDSSGNPKAIKTDANGAISTQVVNSSGSSVSARAVNSAIVGTDVGMVTNTVIHGLSSAGGGTYVDVKVNPSGTLQVEANAGTNLNTSALALESGGNLAATATSLAIMDDWDESDRAKVNPIVGQAGVAGGSGTVSASTQRMVLATDVALPAGTNTIGKLAANSGVDIGDVDVTSAVITGGAVAHDGVDSGNPIKIGHKAVSTQSGQTAVASGDRTDSITDLDGSLITRMTTHGDSVSGVASATGTSDTSVVAAQGASTYFYVTGFTIANTGSTTTLITFKDGSGGSALWYTIAPTTGGSNFSQGGKPIFRTSANTALYFACASASTTVYVSVTGYKSKV